LPTLMTRGPRDQRHLAAVDDTRFDAAALSRSKTPRAALLPTSHDGE
jgi:hypothetical protein